MDRPDGGMPRRAFLTASAAGVAGIAAVALASCTAAPKPTPTRTPSPTPTPTPLPTVEGVPAPLAMARTKWDADPYTLGGTVYEPVGGGAAARQALRESVGDRLWFAGEAIVDETVRPGTLVAARASGAAAADAVLRVADRGDRIAVVGAGVAGLAAANALAAAGHEVVVFEARAKVGGRAASRWADGFDDPVPYGALLVPDDLDLLYELNVAGVRTQTFAPVGRVRRDDGVEVANEGVGEALLQQAHDWALAQPTDSAVSGALIGSGATPVDAVPGDDGTSEADWLVHALASGLDPATGAVSAQVSARSYDPAAEAAALAAAKLPPDGLDVWLGDLAAGLDVAVGSVVAGVRIVDDKVSLRFDTGESFTAHRVIVAVPLGVLKAGSIRFTPELPSAQSNAIAALPTGSRDLVWLRFDEAFWREDATAGSEGGSGDVTPTPEAGEDGPDDAAAPAPGILTLVGRTPTVAAWIDPAVSDAAVLVGVLAAGQARRLELLEDRQFLEAVLADLAPYGVGAAASAGDGDGESDGGLDGGSDEG